MTSFKLLASLCLAFMPVSLAHFIVNIPPPLGSNINNEDVSPCGGFTPSSSDNLTDFHVGGDAISLTSLHAQSYFAYRGMLGSSVSAANWTNLLPIVEEFGLNSFCEPSVAVPSSWAGSSGLLQIIQDAEDGVHYQCMAVNFVAGQGTPPSGCSNSSGVSATFSSDNGILAAEGATTSAAPSGAPTQSSTQSASSTTPSTQATQSSSSKSAAFPTFKLDTISWGLLVGFIIFSAVI